MLTTSSTYGPDGHRDIVRYLPIDGAAQYASVSTKTIQRWIKGGLPVYQGTARGKVLIRPKRTQKEPVESVDKIHSNIKSLYRAKPVAITIHQERIT